MSQYSIALEQKLQMLRAWDVELSRPDTPRPNEQPEHRQMRAGLRRLLPESEVYYWSGGISHAVLESSRTLPLDTTISFTGLPRAGWMWFEKPFKPGIMSRHNELRAISWTLYDRHHEAGTCVLVSYGGPAGCPILDMGLCGLRSGLSLAELAETADRPAHLSQLGAFWVAAMLWIQQEILVVESRPIDRACGRRLERQGEAIQPIQVILLRRAAYASPQNGDSQNTEWSCRWIVRGHWRQQFYPATNERRPIWITPYVKGPEDAPLKTPAPTVFAVTR